MNKRYITDYDLNDYSANNFKNIINNNNESFKPSVLKYLKSFWPCCAVGGKGMTDIVSGEYVDIDDVGYTDGEFTWYASEIYHFEKYNIRLSEDFINYFFTRLGSDWATGTLKEAPYWHRSITPENYDIERTYWYDHLDDYTNNNYYPLWAQKLSEEDMKNYRKIAQWY